MTDHYDCVEEKYRRVALRRLHERVAQGEDPYTILGIQPQHKYYVDKILAGLMPLSYTLYSRIMYNEDPTVTTTY